MNPLRTLKPYSDWLDTYLSEDTKTAYAVDLNQLRKYSKKEVYDCTEEDLNAFIGNQRQLLCDGALTRRMAAISQFFKWQLSMKQRKDNPSGVFEFVVVKAQQKNPKALSVLQSDTLLSILRDKTLHDCQVKLWVILGLNTGLRLSEMMRFKWSDLDEENAKLKVIGKGNKPAELNVPGPLLAEFKTYKQRMSDENISSEWVFFNTIKPSRHYHKSNFAKWCETLKKRAGFGKEIKFTPHVLRHSYCTRIAESKKASPEEAIKMTRHAGLDTYMRYVRIADGQIKKVNKEIFG